MKQTLVDRRAFLSVSTSTLAVAAGTVALATPALAAAQGTPAAKSPAAKSASATAIKKQPPAQPSRKQAARQVVAPLLGDCMQKAMACAAHCETELAAGNKDMAECARAVTDMLALVTALAPLVARESELDGKLAAVCADACAACAKACKAHEPHFAHGMHMACKACMEACQKCEPACRALAAA